MRTAVHSSWRFGFWVCPRLQLDVLIHAIPTLGTITSTRTTNFWDFCHHRAQHCHGFTSLNHMPPSFLLCARKVLSLFWWWRTGRVNGWLIFLLGRGVPFKTGPSGMLLILEEWVSWLVGCCTLGGCQSQWYLVLLHYSEKSYGNRLCLTARSDPRGVFQGKSFSMQQSSLFAVKYLCLFLTMAGISPSSVEP